MQYYKLLLRTIFSFLLIVDAFVLEAQIVRSIDWTDFPVTGEVSESDMKVYGGFDYANRGFGNGPESNHNDAYDLILEDDPFGPGSGRWAKVLSRTWPGEGTVHTFGKAVRAINDGNSAPFYYEEMWIDVPLYIPEEWITHDQGKIGYSLTNPEGTSPGTNPTEDFEMLFHYFSPNNFKSNKAEAPWYSVNPSGPFEEQDMLIGLDAYCADSRVNTIYSEPIFFRENLESEVRKVFEKETNYILRAHIKLNTPNISDGILETWFSEDNGSTWTKSIEVLDFNWRGSQNDNFEKEGFVAFRGGSGHGFEVGGNGAVSKNTGIYNAPQDTWYYLGNINVYESDPFEPVLDFNVFNLDSKDVKSGVLVSWKILDVTESFEVTLERSGDGVSWQPISKKYHASAVIVKEYQYIDKTPKSGVNYYRLVKTSTNGLIEYSEVIIHYLKDYYSEIKIFPNPSSGHLQLLNNDVLLDALTEVSLFNSIGELKHKQDLTLSENEAMIDVSHLQSDIYFVLITRAGEVLSSKKILIKKDKY